MAALKIDKTIYVLVGIALFFTLYLYDPDIGTGFGFVLFLGFMAMSSDDRITNEIEREYKPLYNIGIALLGSAIVILLSSFAKSIPLSSTFQLFANMVPYFKGNVYFTWFAYSPVIGTIETLVIWGAIFGFLIDLLKVRNTGFTNPKMWGIILALSAGFFILHLSAKQGNIADLIPVIIMGTVTGVMVLWEQLQLKSMILMHIFLNSVSILGDTSKFGLPLMYAFGISVGVIALLSYSTKYMRISSTFNY